MAIPTSIQQLKDSFSKDELANDSIRNISQLISSSNLTILELVEGLQTDLLNAQASHRCKAVSAIASVIEQLSPDLKGLNQKEVELVAEFFCSKLKDHHSIVPAALQGLHALGTAPHLFPGLSKVIIQAIFQDVHCQSQLQKDRRKIYKTIKNLLTFHIKELQSIGQEFLFGIIQAADQERDPRNLLILFSIFPVVARYFKLEPFTEEFFEVFSCYFPIDFTPPANDPHAVTKEQLCDGLRKCLASSAQFAEYCLPLLQEKLESDLISAKVEALRTLELCCQTYQPSQLETWIEIFWTSIRKEVLINVNTDELEHASLDALTALSRVFTTDRQFNSPIFTKVLQSILNECQGHLCEPERRLMTPSSYVLLAICAGSPPACSLIVNQVIPLLMDQFYARTQSNPRQFILNSLNKLVHAGLYGYTEENGAQSGIDSLAAALMEFYLKVLDEDDAVLRCLSLQGLAHFIGIRINHQESSRVNSALLALLQQPSLADNVIEELSRFFCKSAEHSPDFFAEQVVQKLLEMAVSGENKAAFKVLNTLPPLAQIRARVIPRLMTLLEEPVPDFKLEVLQVLSHFAQSDELEMFHQLHRWALKTLNEGDPSASLHATCALLSHLASGLSSGNASRLIDELTDQYTSQYINSSIWTVLIMEATLGSFDATPTGQSLARLLRTLDPITVSHSNAEIRLAACRLVAAIINKLPEGNELEILLDSLKLRWRDPSIDPSNAVCLFVWITKALLMRSYSRVDQSIAELVESLNDSKNGHLVAEGFKTILCETNECLNFNSHANIRLMYRQRFFQEVVPRLLKLYRESDSCNKAACFAAIANQLAFIPDGVLIAHITTLIPLLVQCLAVEQPPELIISTINAFMSLIADNVNAIENYVDNIVPRLLTLAKDGGTMNIRRLALQCIAELRKAQSIVLLPLRNEVIRRLVPCLDDKKRLVRREAALARQKWIMLGQAGC